jgi:hypothetical protein
MLKNDNTSRYLLFLNNNMNNGCELLEYRIDPTHWEFIPDFDGRMIDRWNLVEHYDYDDPIIDEKWSYIRLRRQVAEAVL